MSLIQNPIPKQAIVGSLLICPLDPSKNYQLATWYRIVGENRKIIKMERIKGSGSVSYRCTVFDIGAMIEILLENCNEDQFQTYGPVKFDNYLAKQLEISITNNTWFSANLHIKINETISAKIRVTINEKGALQVNIQIKKQEFCIKIPYKENWRIYEDIFSIENIKLTEVCLKNVQISEENKNQSVVHRILREKKYVLITFLNVVQRNIFLAQIVLKTKDRQLTIKRLSQLKIDEKNLDSQVQKLFQSNISSNQFKITQLSQKVINDFQDVVFTPSIENEQIHDKQFCSLFFDQFLNPESKKEPFVQKLSQIQQQEGDVEKIPSSSHINQNLKKSSRKVSKPFLQKAETQRKKVHEQSIDQIIQQHKLLLKQNQKLKRQNKMLRMRLSKQNLKVGQVKYQLPLFFRNSARNIKLTHDKPPQFSHKNRKMSRLNNWNSEKIFFSQLQSPKSFSKQKHSDSTDNMKQLMIESRKKQVMSMSTKTLRHYFHGHGHDSCNKSK